MTTAVRNFTESNATCAPLLLTVKLGPHSGTTLIDCTCGWVRTYPTRRGAVRCAREHLKLTGGQ